MTPAAWKSVAPSAPATKASTEAASVRSPSTISTLSPSFFRRATSLPRQHQAAHAPVAERRRERRHLGQTLHERFDEASPQPAGSSGDERAVGGAHRQRFLEVQRVASGEGHHGPLRVHAGRVGQHARVVDVEVLGAVDLAERVGGAAVAALADGARRERVDGREAERRARQALVEPADGLDLAADASGGPAPSGAPASAPAASSSVARRASPLLRLMMSSSESS